MIEILCFLFLFQIIILKSIRIDNAYRNIIFSIISFLELSFVVGARHYSIGVDSLRYIDFMKDFYVNGQIQFDLSKEIGYRMLNLTLLNFTETYTSLFFVIAIIFYFFLIRLFYKETKFIWIAIIIFICLGGFTLSISALRQCVACGFIFLSYDFLLKKRHYLFLAMVLIASTFHKSALIFIIIYFFTFLPYNKKYNLIIFFTISITSLFSLQILKIMTIVFPKYINYSDIFLFTMSSQYQTLNIGYFTSVLIKSFLFFIPMIFCDEYFLKKNNSLFWLALICLFFMWNSFTMRIFSRIEFYFFPFLILFFCKYLESLIEYKKYFLPMTSLLSILFIYRLIIIFNNYDSFLNYRFFWE